MRHNTIYPAYLDAFKSGKLKKTAEQLFDSLESCVICPRKCKVNRLKNRTEGRGLASDSQSHWPPGRGLASDSQSHWPPGRGLASDSQSHRTGFCKTGKFARVYSFMRHHGEEPPVSGSKGSGAIFFSHCNMGCVYCQNYEFSQKGAGREYTFDELAGLMLKLQGLGCHNINLVTPTHVLPQILLSLELAIPQGLKIPLVYNTGGYELVEIIKLLDGIVDIYLPDMRYADSAVSRKLSKAPDYPEYNQQAVKEMQRQAGRAEFDAAGLIKRGLIIRHLVLPNQLSGTDKIMRFIAKEISEDTYISLMSQYLPYHLAFSHPEISRRLKKDEYEEAKKILEDHNLLNGWTQESCASERFAGVNIKPA